MSESAHPADRAANLFDAFRRVAETRGGTPALDFADGVVTFAELIESAARAHAELDRLGARRGDVVALRLPKRREAYVLWLAALRAGCPYVFIDPRNPAARDAKIVDRVRPALLAADGGVANPFGATLTFGSAEAGRAWLEGLSGAPPAPAAATGLDPAYIMFTSGSTGEPKGAAIPHQGVLSLMRWARAAVDDCAGARVSNLNPLHFDNSVFDLYCGLLNGRTLVPVETSASPNPAHWLRRLRDARAEIVFAVPTLFQTLQALNLLTPESLPDAKAFLFGGEGFPIAALRRFHDAFRGRARLVNVYGPTETSCICSSLEIDAAALAAAGDGFVSLGRMHDGFRHAILDADGGEIARGEIGELWIGGANVGLGYYADPEETARRFRQDPRQADYRSIWYRSGDLVREDEDGLLWFAGRADNQVKIRGHRIELEEIDLAAETAPGVERAVAVAVAGEDGPEIRLAVAGGSGLSEADLRAHCAARLPAYMQPALVLVVDALPVNANGKVDRRAARALFEGAS